MQLDECPALPAPRERVAEAMELSLRWAKRCKTAFGARDAQNLFAIVQGGTDAELRKRSAEALIAEGFDGYAIGGLAVGEGHEAMLATLDVTAPLLPQDRPRYLMGVGKPIDIVESVARGVDMFDCVLPTRSGRHGQAWTDQGPLNIKNARFAEDETPLDASIDCPASRDYSKAYLHHLFKAGELLSQVLLSWHNIAYYQSLMARMRVAIAEGRLEDFRAGFAGQHLSGD
jgi:queuine tRNA-ribosyltransferase